MATVLKTMAGFKATLFGGRMCDSCGYVQEGRIGPCPWCAAEARLAEAVAALRAEDDYDAINAAADAIGSVLIDAPVFRNRSPWRRKPAAVRTATHPGCGYPGTGRDDDRDDDEN
jgi:hypothetical protein